MGSGCKPFGWAHDEVSIQRSTTPVLDLDRGRDRRYIFCLKCSTSNNRMSKSAFICIRLQFLCVYTIFIFSCQSLKRGISITGNSSAHRKGTKSVKVLFLESTYWKFLKTVWFYCRKYSFFEVFSHFYCFFFASFAPLRWIITKEVYPAFQSCWVTNLVNEGILHVHCLVNKTLDTFI